MGLGVEVSSAVFAQASRNSSTSSGLWVAFGSQIALFDLSLSTLVLKLSEATRTFQVLPSLHDEDDVLNEVRLSRTTQHVGLRRIRPLTGRYR